MFALSLLTDVHIIEPTVPKSTPHQIPHKLEETGQKESSPPFKIKLSKSDKELLRKLDLEHRQKMQAERAKTEVAHFEELMVNMNIEGKPATAILGEEVSAKLDSGRIFVDSNLNVNIGDEKENRRDAEKEGVEDRANVTKVEEIGNVGIKSNVATESKMEAKANVEVKPKIQVKPNPKSKLHVRT